MYPPIFAHHNCYYHYYCYYYYLPLAIPGTVTATQGPAQGTTSVEIGVGESSTTSAGSSLQLVGLGASYADFTWISDANPSFGEVTSVNLRSCSLL